MIQPTIGRVVLFYPNGETDLKYPMPALVCFVHEGGEINVGAFDYGGNPIKGLSIVLRQEGDPVPDMGTPYAEWMPYQIKAAARDGKLDALAGSVQQNS